MVAKMKTLDSLIRAMKTGAKIGAGIFTAAALSTVLSCGNDDRKSMTTTISLNPVPMISGFTAFQRENENTVDLKVDAMDDSALDYTFQSKLFSEPTYTDLAPAGRENTYAAQNTQFNTIICYRAAVSDRENPAVYTQESCLSLKDLAPPFNAAGQAVPCSNPAVPGSTPSNTLCLTAQAEDNDSISTIDLYRAGLKIGTIQPGQVFYETGLTPDTTYTFAATAKDPSNNQTSVAFRGTTDP